MMIAEIMNDNNTDDCGDMVIDVADDDDDGDDDDDILTSVHPIPHSVYCTFLDRMYQPIS